MLILIGHNDSAYLGSGWHPPQEGPAGLPCRWMSQQASLTIPPPAAMEQASTAPARVCVTVSAPAKIREQKPGLSLYAAGELLGHCADLGPEGHWATALYEITRFPLQQEPAVVTLAVENRTGAGPVQLAFIPHETLKNGDLRELGVLVSTIRIQA